jgi:hypothetical protein
MYEYAVISLEVGWLVVNGFVVGCTALVFTVGAYLY